MKEPPERTQMEDRLLFDSEELKSGDSPKVEGNMKSNGATEKMLYCVAKRKCRPLPGEGTHTEI